MILFNTYLVRWHTTHAHMCICTPQMKWYFVFTTNELAMNDGNQSAMARWHRHFYLFATFNDCHNVMLMHYYTRPSPHGRTFYRRHYDTVSHFCSFSFRQFALLPNLIRPIHALWMAGDRGREGEIGGRGKNCLLVKFNYEFTVKLMSLLMRSVRDIYSRHHRDCVLLVLPLMSTRALGVWKMENILLRLFLSPSLSLPPSLSRSVVSMRKSNCSTRRHTSTFGK